MKVLFLMFHGFSDHSGISKKIKGQVKGLVENGVQVDLAYYDIDTNGMRSWVVADRSVAILGNGLVGKIRKRFDFAALLDFIVSQQYGLVYIRNYHNANPFTIKLVNGIKNEKIQQILIHTYKSRNEPSIPQNTAFLLFNHLE